MQYGSIEVMRSEKERQESCSLILLYGPSIVCELLMRPLPWSDNGMYQ